MSRKRKNWKVASPSRGHGRGVRLSGVLLVVLLILALGAAALFMSGLVEGPGTPGEDGRVPLELPERERHPLPDGVERP